MKALQHNTAPSTIPESSILCTGSLALSRPAKSLDTDQRPQCAHDRAGRLAKSMYTDQRPNGPVHRLCGAVTASKSMDTVQRPKCSRQSAPVTVQGVSNRQRNSNGRRPHRKLARPGHCSPGPCALGSLHQYSLRPLLRIPKPAGRHLQGCEPEGSPHLGCPPLGFC